MDVKTVDLLEAAIRKRCSLSKHTNALRLVNGPGDGLAGLVLEQYNRHFAAHIFHERWFSREEELAAFLRKRFDVRYMIAKDRTEPVSSRPEAVSSRVLIKHDASETVVLENGLSFSVDLNDGVNSGLFLDMRRNRKIVSEFACGGKVLNCFSYTCSFGVYCRVFGASSVVNVDTSQKSLSRGRLNYGLNRLNCSADEFIRADAFQYLRRASVKGNLFELIILDPPSFSRHEGKVFSVKKDLARLIALAVKALKPGGFLFVSTNFSGLSNDSLERMLKAQALPRRIKTVKRLGQDVDFPAGALTRESHLAALLAEL